jgi:hypothetical protein
MNDMTDLVSTIMDMDKVMSEIYALVRLNAEAESHAVDLFEQLKDKILTHKIDRNGFEKHALEMKYAISMGRKYSTKTMNCLKSNYLLTILCFVNFSHIPLLLSLDLFYYQWTIYIMIDNRSIFHTLIFQSAILPYLACASSPAKRYSITL